MPRERLTFRQRDITAAIKAIERAGGKVVRVEIGKDGRIIMDLTPPSASETAPDSDPNPWDEAIKDAFKD